MGNYIENIERTIIEVLNNDYTLHNVDKFTSECAKRMCWDSRSDCRDALIKGIQKLIKKETLTESWDNYGYHYIQLVR